MHRPAHLPAKLTRPAAGGLIPRPRLLALVERAPTAAWLCGPAGAGKTALAASYLEARRPAAGWYQLDARDADLATFFDYMDRLARHVAPARRPSLPAFTAGFAGGAAAFTRRFFEGFFERCPRPFALVLDDYDAIPAGAPLHEAMAELLAAVPRGCRVLVTSRDDPPAPLARLRGSRALEVVGGADLRLTAAEIRALVRARAGRRRAPVAADRVAAASQGWAAGAVLLIDAALESGARPEPPGDAPPGTLFDYFMAEVLAKLPAEERRALLALSLLPAVTAPAATEATEWPGAAELLDRLSRRQCFVERRDGGEVMYRFHPLFHQVLRADAAAELPEPERRRILLAGAGHLAERGHADDAAALLVAAQEWKALERLVVEQGPRLLRAGRGGAVLDWLQRIPEDVVADSPWLLYWLGTAGSGRGFAFAREHLGRAARALAATGDTAGLAAALAGILDTFFLESDGYVASDPWIDMAAALVEGSRPHEAELPPALFISLLRVLIYRRPDHPLLPLLRDRLHVIRGEARDGEHAAAAGLVLALHYAWVGAPMTAAPLVQSAREQAAASRDVAMLQAADYVEGFVAVKLGDGERCERAVAEGLERAAHTGMHAVDFRLHGLGVYAGRMRHDPARAARSLAWMRDHLPGARLVDRGHYHLLAGWDLALRGDVDRAYHETRTALGLTEEAGVPPLIGLSAFLLAQLAHERGDAEEARGHLARMRAIATGMASQSMLFMTEVVEADFAQSRGASAEATRLLRQGLERARRNRLRFYSGWRPSTMARICVAALEADVCVEHVQDLIRHHGIAPDRAPLDVPNWPWAVEVRALGALRLHRDGQELRMSGKAPQRPLDLLRAIAALGGRHVPAQRLIDALWPDAEGDAGQVALDTTLLRLRRLLQHGAALIVEGGRVSLDEGQCWLDVWALERWLDRAEALLPRAAAPAELARPVQEALRLYSGALLADCDQPWAVAPRERLRRRLLRALEAVGRARERAGDLDGALGLFLRGLEVDDLAESLYQGAMRCYAALGRQAEGLALHQRCRRVLGAQLGIEPSAETQSVAASLRTPPARR